MVCRHADFAEPWYKDQELNLLIRRLRAGHPSARAGFLNRKWWEFCAIAQALDERGFLQTGKTGLGFAVGRELLPSHFATRGCRILATDLADASTEWAATNQHASSREAIYYPELAHRDVFDKRVAFRPADMRTLDGLEPGFDFLWSSCAFEHLGSLRMGMDFVLNSAGLLKPGGLAVHTTEFNVRSDDETLEDGDSVIYRKRDILALGDELAERGLRLVPPNFDSGDHPFDLDYDTAPYMASDKPHLKLELGGHVCTSMLLIIEKPA
jgi:hypothetical protein